MSELKATPGPWAIGDENNSSVELDIGPTFASFDREDKNTCEYVISREEMLANAHLAAAAPDLYEALENALVLLEHNAEQIDGEWGICRNLAQIEADGDLDQEIVEARAALSKARGES